MGSAVLSFSTGELGWVRGGQHFLLSSAASSTAAHSVEKVIVEWVDSSSGQMGIAYPLQHDYPAGSIATRLSRSIHLMSQLYSDGGGTLKIVPPVSIAPVKLPSPPCKTLDAVK